MQLRKVVSAVGMTEDIKFTGSFGISHDENFDLTHVSGVRIGLYEIDDFPYRLSFWYLSRVEYVEPGYELPDMFTEGQTISSAVYAVSLRASIEESDLLDKFDLPEDQQYDGGEYYVNNTYFNKRYIGSLAIPRTESHADAFFARYRVRLAPAVRN